MRVVTWNLGANSVPKPSHDAALRHLLDRAGLNADVALVQEAVLPPELAETHQVHWSQAWPNSRGHNWGTAIIAKPKYSLSPIGRLVPDTRFVMANLTTDQGDFAVVSVHSFTAMDGRLYSDRRAASFIDRLQANFDAFRDVCVGRFIVGGDLNTSRAAETMWPGQGHSEFWARLDEEGFYTCPWSKSGEELTTYRHPSGPFAGQADHILLHRRTATEATVETFVPDLGPGLSDHLPLVVDLGWR